MQQQPDPLDSIGPLILPNPGNAPPQLANLLDSAVDAVVGLVVENLPFLIAGIALFAIIGIVGHLMHRHMYGPGVKVEENGQTSMKI